MTPSDRLITIGRTTEGVRCFDGDSSDLLMGLAQKHATDMANRCKQSHRGWSARFAVIQHALHVSAAEICAETWKHQKNDPLDLVAIEMYRCWRQSSGHWRIASSAASMYGASMAQGNNGVWYACIIAAEGERSDAPDRPTTNA